MATNASSVNYQNLIRDLAEMYPFEVDEVVLVELIANSLDAKATCISINYDPQTKVLIVTDNGKGMDASQFDEYHDFAAGIKTRGTGIGFAGVGAKISFNIADRVITETRSEGFSGGSDWYLKSKKKLLWDDIQPTHLSGNGTRVEVRFRPDTNPSYSSREDIVKLLQRHYLPLLDEQFLMLYNRMGYYSDDLRFIINGQPLIPSNVKEDLDLDKVKTFIPKKSGKGMGYGVLGLSASEYPIGQNVCGVLLCTYGKVIKADLFNQFPGSFGPRLFGLVEIPKLVNFLTTSKTDFIRGPGRNREFESLYNPVRQAFKDWLAEIGIQPVEISDIDESIKIEREIKKLLEDIPELSDFFGFRARKPILQQSDTGIVTASLHEGADITFPIGEGISGGNSGPVDIGDQPGEALLEDQESGSERARPISRTAKRGPKITFASAPDRMDLAWVDGNSVVINSSHPAYNKARSNSTARILHSLFAIASAVQRFMVGPDNNQDLMFIDRMMSSWGRK